MSNRKLYSRLDFIGRLLSQWRTRAVLPHVTEGVHLDLACGDNRLVRQLGRGYGLDITNYSGADLVVEDFEALPFADASIDSVSILAALNYFASPGSTLCEVERVLKPQGRVIITLLSKRVSAFWHKFRDRNLPRITFDEEEFSRLVQPSHLVVCHRSTFMLGMNHLYVLRKGVQPCA